MIDIHTVILFPWFNTKIISLWWVLPLVWVFWKILFKKVHSKQNIIWWQQFYWWRLETCSSEITFIFSNEAELSVDKPHVILCFDRSWDRKWASSIDRISHTEAQRTDEKRGNSNHCYCRGVHNHSLQETTQSNYRHHLTQMLSTGIFSFSSPPPPHYCLSLSISPFSIFL